ncbi:MAG: hypothetical protein UU06_C0014G0011 [Parcubacteria group bacterium GW2011_GWB1_40_5]|nr:MAG: hypothetical protein UU06_C0014G0011 [Parcubacteria group bacterium GW2011_GWB1_40_5]OHA86769.1 MAG: hypothetical protein A2123_01570 [Candidatus Zambryskibacteria bacterium GWB1_40_5]
MPVVKVWGLPADISEDTLRAIHKSIVAATMSVEEFGVTDEKSMTTLFPKDMMTYGLGTEIIIEVLSRRSAKVRPVTRDRLAAILVSAVCPFFPDAMVECLILPFREEDGFFHLAGTRS